MVAHGSLTVIHYTYITVFIPDSCCIACSIQPTRTALLNVAEAKMLYTLFCVNEPESKKKKICYLNKAHISGSMNWFPINKLALFLLTNNKLLHDKGLMLKMSDFESL